MTDENHSMDANSEKSRAQAAQIPKALSLCERLGAKLKALAHSPSYEQTALKELISLTKRLIKKLEGIDKMDRSQSRQAEELAQSTVPSPIPRKPYYKIGEVAEILNLEPYVLRYWESEFKILKPTRTRARQRLYSAQDLEIFKEIARLQSEEKLTVAGIRKRLQEVYPESTVKDEEVAPISKRPSATTITIPDKQYFKLGEVSEILDVEPYVLRYWESEYKILPPTRTRARQRLYHKQHVEKLRLIKHLLYDEKYTIAGVGKILKEMRNGDTAEGGEAKTTQVSIREYGTATHRTSSSRPDIQDALAEILRLLQELKESLE